MAAPFPGRNFAHLLSLPARHFAVVDAGRQRSRILLATVARGRPKVVRTVIIDSHEEGFTTADELRDETRRRLAELDPEAIVVVLPEHILLRHVLDVPRGDPEDTRALLEREASSIGGLSQSAWAFDAVHLDPLPGHPDPLAAVFCRQDDLQQILDSLVPDESAVFDVRTTADALAAAFVSARPEARDAILVNIGASHTAVTLLANGQAVFAASFPTGSAAFTEALAADRGGSFETAEVLKRTEPPDLSVARTRWIHALRTWIDELERTLREWEAWRPPVGSIRDWPVHIAGGGALQPGLPETLSQLGRRSVLPWPAEGLPDSVPSDFAAAWGALILAVGHAGSAPSLLPPERRAGWQRRRVWRAVVSINFALSAMLAVALVAATIFQSRLLREKAQWRREASVALQHAYDIRALAEEFNARMDAFRPVIMRQRRTVQTLEILNALREQRTNADHWYVLLADARSYAAGSNHFTQATSPPPPALAAPMPASLALPNALTNLPPSPRTFIAEICLVPEGEQMRQSLSEIVGALQQFPVFDHVDVLPPERRRSLVATNLIFPERHFALELELSRTQLLPRVPLDRDQATNREPRFPFRPHIRSETSTNGSRLGRPR